MQWSLRAGALYFLCIALAHTIGLKVPGLFIYFNVPSYPYQDHIIAFLAFGWSAFYYAASASLESTPRPAQAVLLSSTVAICGLMRINLLDDLNTIAADIHVAHFWIQTGLLTIYVSWLYIAYAKSRA